MTNKKSLEWWVFLVSGGFISAFFESSPILSLIGAALVVCGLGLGVLTLIRKTKAKK